MNDYQASAELIAHVKPTEKLALVPYVDIAGYTTWGYGHKARPGEQVPMVITEEQADVLLAADLMIAGSAVREGVTVEMTQSQFDGFSDFAFNLGRQAFLTSSMLMYFNVGNTEGAAQECLKWDHAHVGGHLTELAGLKIRREWDAAHIAPSDGSVVWTPADEVRDAPLTFPTLDHVNAPVTVPGAPIADGAVNVPTLTAEATPQQIEAAAVPAETPAVP